MSNKRERVINQSKASSSTNSFQEIMLDGRDRKELRRSTSGGANKGLRSVNKAEAHGCSWASRETLKVSVPLKQSKFSSNLCR